MMALRSVRICSQRLLSTSAVSQHEHSKAEVKPKDKAETFMTEEEMKHQKALQQYITLDTPNDISLVSGVPEEHIKSRRAFIHVPTKNSMQSGTNNLLKWCVTFETRERWENHLMGWASSADPLSNTEINFGSKEEAIAHCEKNGWPWHAAADPTTKPERVKSYAENFSWNKRTRRSNK